MLGERPAWAVGDRDGDRDGPAPPAAPPPLTAADARREKWAKGREALFEKWRTMIAVAHGNIHEAADQAAGLSRESPPAARAHAYAVAYGALRRVGLLAYARALRRAAGLADHPGRPAACEKGRG